MVLSEIYEQLQQTKNICEKRNVWIWMVKFVSHVIIKQGGKYAVITKW